MPVMANHRSPISFLDLHFEIRSMIYELIFYKKYPLDCIVWVHKRDGKTVYRVHRHVNCRDRDDADLKMGILRLNRQIYHEASEAKRFISFQLTLSTKRCVFFAPKPSETRYVFFETESLYSVFGRARHVEIPLDCFNIIEGQFHDDLDSLEGGEGTWYTDCLKSLLPPPQQPQQDVLSLRSLVVNIEVDDTALEYTGSSDHVLKVLDPFAKLVPAVVNVNFIETLYTGMGADPILLQGFRRSILGEIKTRRAEHVRRMTTGSEVSLDK